MWVTNKEREDGFGSQLQSIIISIIYAEWLGLKFAYSPFKAMEHNYNNEEGFIEKKEKFINIKGNYPLITDLPVGTTVQVLDIQYIYSFFENLCLHTIEQLKHAPLNLHSSMIPLHERKTGLVSSQLDRLKTLFFKDKVNPFASSHQLNIAIHIRRPNPHDNRVAGTNVPDEFFIKMIRFFKSEFPHCKIHLFSQGNVEEFQAIYGQFEDIDYHINGEVEEVFTCLCFADIAVLSPSSLSYSAGILARGTVYYTPFWHAPLPNWINIQTLI